MGAGGREVLYRGTYSCIPCFDLGLRLYDLELLLATSRPKVISCCHGSHCSVFLGVSARCGPFQGSLSQVSFVLGGPAFILGFRV